MFLTQPPQDWLKAPVYKAEKETKKRKRRFPQKSGLNQLQKARHVSPSL